MKRLVLLGGGHAHVYVLDRLARERPAGVEIVLVTPSARQLYSGMLPGWIAGAYPLDACAIPLAPLVERAGARLIEARCAGFDPDARLVECADGARLEYDLLSIDVGSTTAVAAIPGARQYAIPVRPLEAFAAAVDALLRDAEEGGGSDVVMIGGGAAGVEIAFALEARLMSLGRPDARVSVVGASPRPLDGLPALAQRRARALMGERGIAWFGGERVSKVGAQGVTLSDGRTIGASKVFVATGAAAHPWLAASGIATDAAGFIRVHRTLRSRSHPDVFAAGDCAEYADVRPKSGVFAVRAGPPLVQNLLRALRGESALPWRPQRRALYLVSAGPGDAIGVWGPLACRGGWLWRLKDRIDRRFIARFSAAG